LIELRGEFGGWVGLFFFFSSSTLAIHFSPFIFCVVVLDPEVRLIPDIP